MPVSVELPRWRWRRRADDTLKTFWRAPLPAGSTDWREVEFLAIDGEMSSLDPNEGELLSLGWVVVQGGAIALNSASHQLIQAPGAVGQSATIHHLRDCDVAAGVPVSEVMEALLGAARGRVLIFHYAPLDLAYLDRLTRLLHGAPLLQPWLCTLETEKRLLERRQHLFKPGDLTLAETRRRYHLPDYHGHNALWDALATAELFLAQLARRGGRLSLKQI